MELLKSRNFFGFNARANIVHDDGCLPKISQIYDNALVNRGLWGI
jgi:hypothetical protein